MSARRQAGRTGRSTLVAVPYRRNHEGEGTALSPYRVPVHPARVTLPTVRPASQAGTLLLALLLVGGVVVLMWPGYDRPAGVFDEGTLLAYPVRVLHGEVPHRDFITFYGPGGPWLLAGVYEVFGATLAAERTVGLFYDLVVAGSMFALCLRWGRMAALASAATASVLLVGFDLAANA